MNGETSEPGGLGPDDPDHDGIRGWVDPDDRLWRHPSELAAARAPSGRPAGGPVRRGRGGRATWLASGVAVAGVLLIGGLMVFTTGVSSDAGHRIDPSTVSTYAALDGSPTTEPGTVESASDVDIARLVTSVRSSLVALIVTRRSGTASGTGVVTEPGGIVTTTASTVAGATSIMTIEPDGQRLHADLVGVDRTSGIAVVQVGIDLPVASFDTGDLVPGNVATEVALVPGRNRSSAPVPLVYAGTVRSSGTAVDDDAVTTTFAATAVSAPLGRGQSGCPLLDPGGNVSGILETTKLVGGKTVSAFLPAGLVLGVTQQLVTNGAVDRGWLGIDASDELSTAATPTNSTSPAKDTGAVTSMGVLVDAIDAGSGAAAAGLEPGDTIAAVDGQPVHSMAELRTRLYADVPGTAVTVTYRRGASTATTTVVLGAADTTASASRPAS